MRATLSMALAMSASCLSSDVWADYESGFEGYKRGDYAIAAQEWQGLAEAGHVRAQVGLGWLYLNGRGVAQDYVLARQFFEKATAQLLRSLRRNNWQRSGWSESVI